MRTLIRMDFSSLQTRMTMGLIWCHRVMTMTMVKKISKRPAEMAKRPAEVAKRRADKTSKVGSKSMASGR